MHIEQALQLTHTFFDALAPIIGPVTFTITPPLDADVLPDELHKLGGKKNGLYLLSAKQDGRVIYIGISESIPDRIYKHIGPGITWARKGAEAAFPGCTLAVGRYWLSEPTQELLRKAQFLVTAILLEPPEAKALLESFLVFWGHENGCKPEINVEL
jgi:hypothetical protein